MEKRNWITLTGLLFVLGIALVACPNPVGDKTITINDYISAGENVASKEYKAGEYDCSNYSIQFYQNCYKANLPCRIRFGISGGEYFLQENHAWNSVKINEQWFDWEPQLNDIYDGHKKTETPLGKGWGSFTEEDLSRMIYELIGRNVPGSIIDNYEIDAYIYENSPFNKYFNGYCISDDMEYNSIVSLIKPYAPNDGSGAFAITADQLHIGFFYNMKGKYYGVENMEENDPVEGRSVFGQNGLIHDFTTAVKFGKPDIRY